MQLNICKIILHVKHKQKLAHMLVQLYPSRIGISHIKSKSHVLFQISEDLETFLRRKNDIFQD